MLQQMLQGGSWLLSNLNIYPWLLYFLMEDSISHVSYFSVLFIEKLSCK